MTCKVTAVEGVFAGRGASTRVGGAGPYATIPMNRIIPTYINDANISALQVRCTCPFIARALKMADRHSLARPLAASYGAQSFSSSAAPEFRSRKMPDASSPSYYITTFALTLRCHG